MRRMIGVVAGLVLLGAAAPAWASALVVMEARGVALKPGETIEDSKTLTLKDGEQLLLLADDGSVLTIRGPYEGTAAGSGKVGVVQALDALTTRTAQRNVAGVVRDASVEVHLPSPWLVDVSHPGAACVQDGQRPIFWRASGQSNALTIMPSDRSWRAEAPWPAGSATLQAPDYFPVRDGRTYLASFGEGKPVAVTINMLPPSLGNARMQAAWMLEKGCVAQAEALLKTVR